MAAVAGFAQGIVATIAGTDWFFPARSLPPLDAPLGGVSALAVDPGGSLYLADPDNLLVFRYRANQPLTVFAGTGLFFPSGDGGSAVDAGFNFPGGVAVGREGAVYITDRSNHRIRVVAPNGTVSTLAGQSIAGGGFAGFSGDGGPAALAELNRPTGIAADSAGNVYFIDQGNHRIRRISANGIITTYAGAGEAGDGGDGGPATQARFQFGASAGPSLAVDVQGNLFVADINNHRVRRITPDGRITTIAGTGVRGYSGDGGPAAAAQLAQPFGVAADAAGTLYIADYGNSRIRAVTRDGVIRTIAGNGQLDYGGDGGPALQAAAGLPLAITVDSEGNLFFSDYYANRIRRVRPDGAIQTIAGNGRFRFSGDGGPAPAAHLLAPAGIAVARDGTVYVADTSNNRIRAVSPGGALIRTIAGDGAPRFGGDGGLATRASLSRPEGIALDAQGNLFFADSSNNRIRRVTPQGVIETVAGNGQRADAGDNGPAKSASFLFPRGVAADAAGAIYVADADAHRIRRILPSGIIETFAGTGAAGFGGDGGPARQAALRAPTGVAVDGAGNVYIADRGNHRIRRVASNGSIVTVAGNGQPGSLGDGGPATAAQLNLPFAVALDASGLVYIADTRNNRVRRINRDGTISLVAGYSVNAGYCCDGALATLAIFFEIGGVAVDAAGSVYVLDSGNARVRQILTRSPEFRVDRTPLRFSGRAGGAPPPMQRISVTGSLGGIRFAASARTQSGGAWLTVRPARGETPRLLEVDVDPASLNPGAYEGTVTVLADSGVAEAIDVPVRFEVGEGLPPAPSLDRNQLTFISALGSVPPAQTLTVRNSGSGALRLSIEVSTSSGGAWLSVTQPQATVTPRSPGSVEVKAEPGGLGPGTYTGTITVRSALAEARSIPVTLIVSRRAQAIALTQTGLSFTTVAGGGRAPPQTFGVLNSGSGVMRWTASTTTLSGGAWLSATPGSGSTDAESNRVPIVEVKVDASGLDPGRYYGLVNVDSTEAAGTPQAVTVFLEVLPADANPGQAAQPLELTFRMAESEDMPPAQEVLVYNLLAQPLSLQTNLVSERAEQILRFVNRPRTFPVRPNEPARVVVQPFAVDFPAAGTYRGTMTLQFSDGTVRTVGLGLIVTPASRARAADGCSPGRLVPALVSLAQSSSIPAGWPAPITVDLRDDCGGDVTTGSLTASFSTGDPPVSLQSLRNGRWQGTWHTRSASSGTVTVTLEAQDPARGLSGALQVAANLRSSQDPPEITAEGVVSAASPRPLVPLAPGAMISLFGQRLAEQTQLPEGTPLPTRLAQASVIMAGQQLPLLYAAPGQINTVVPFDLEPNATYQVLVRRGTTLSRPAGVNVAPAQPAIFENGQAIAEVIRGDLRFLNSPSAPARAGDTLVLYCSGLGPVDGMMALGAPAPLDKLIRAQNEVKVRVDGIDAGVSFAGLTPGFVGLYQINFTLPEGVAAGDAIPVAVETGGQVSAPAALAVR